MNVGAVVYVPGYMIVQPEFAPVPATKGNLATVGTTTFGTGVRGSVDALTLGVHVPLTCGSDVAIAFQGHESAATATLPCTFRLLLVPVGPVIAGLVVLPE